MQIRSHFRTLMSLFVILLAISTSCFGEKEQYAVARIPTPVFNMSDFPRLFGGKDGHSLLTDPCRQLRPLEFIALPGTPFRIEGAHRVGDATIYRVTTGDYPYETRSGYFVDSRFVTLADLKPPERERRLPSREEVVERLLKAEGSIYVWGGNVRSGIPQMAEFYPPSGGGLTPDLLKRWNLVGVDCSGLLYEATDGFTPRNTSSLVRYGTPVQIAGLPDAEIMKRVAPLDLIVWNGHVLIILDRQRVIESHLDCGHAGGVRVRPLSEALAGIRKKRTPMDAWPDDKAKQGNSYVIRRWYTG